MTMSTGRSFDHDRTETASKGGLDSESRWNITVLQYLGEEERTSIQYRHTEAWEYGNQTPDLSNLNLSTCDPNRCEGESPLLMKCQGGSFNWAFLCLILSRCFSSEQNSNTSPRSSAGSDAIVVVVSLAIDTSFVLVKVA